MCRRLLQEMNPTLWDSSSKAALPFGAITDTHTPLLVTHLAFFALCYKTTILLQPALNISDLLVYCKRE